MYGNERQQWKKQQKFSTKDFTAPIMKSKKPNFHPENIWLFSKKNLEILAKLTKNDAMNWDFKTFNSLTKLSLICRVVAPWDMMHNANFFSGKIYSQNRHKHVSTSSLALLSRWSQKIYNCLAPPSIERNNIP